MKKYLFALVLCILSFGCSSVNTSTLNSEWNISVLPSSVRLDPTTNKIIDQRFILLRDDHTQHEDLLKKNLIYNNNRISLYSARGEYVSFQLVLTNNTGKTLKGIRIYMPAFRNNETQFSVKPEFFL